MVNHIGYHRSDPRERCQGRKPLAVRGSTSADLEPPGSGLHPVCLIKRGKVPPAPKRQFLDPELQIDPDRCGVEEETEGRKRLGLLFGDSILSYSLGHTKFIVGRELQNGFGEIFSTLFILTFQRVSEMISSDLLRKFRE